MTELNQPGVTFLQKHGVRLMWLGVAAVAATLGHDLRGATVAPALVDVRSSQLLAPAGARVVGVSIKTGQVVTAGDPLIELDATEADLELAHALAELERIRMTVTAREADVEGQEFELGTRLATEHEKASMALTTLVGEVRRIQTELEGVTALLDRETRLVARQLQGGQSLEELKLRRAGLEQRLAEADNGRVATERVEQAAQKRLAAWKARHGGAALTGPERAAVLAQEERVKRARWFKERFVVRAPMTGRVSHVGVGVGDVVGGSAILATIVDAAPTQATAWVSEELAWQVHVGDAATLRSLDGRGLVVQGTVRELGPGILEAPERLRQLPGEPLFARAVYIELHREGGAAPVPGQTFETSFTTSDAKRPQRHDDAQAGRDATSLHPGGE